MLRKNCFLVFVVQLIHILELENGIDDGVFITFTFEAYVDHQKFCKRPLYRAF